MGNIQLCENCVHDKTLLFPPFLLPHFHGNRGTMRYVHHLACYDLKNGDKNAEDSKHTAEVWIVYSFSVTIIHQRIKVSIYGQYNRQCCESEHTPTHCGAIFFCLFRLRLYHLSPHESSAGSSSPRGNSCRSAAVTGYLTWM